MKLKNFSSKYQKSLSFCYNLTQLIYSKCIYRVEYTCHRLEIIKHTSAHSQNKTAYGVKQR